MKVKGVTTESIFVHPNDADPFPSSSHGHIGSPNSPVKVDVNTGEIYRGAAKTGEKLSAKQLANLRGALKKAGLLLSVVLGVWEVMTADGAWGAVWEVLDPLNPIKGEIAPDFDIPTAPPIPKPSPSGACRKC